MKPIPNWVKILTLYFSAMVLPVISNWLSESVKDNFNFPINNLPLILFLSVAVVVISAIFLEQLVDAKKNTNNGKPIKNPTNPESPLLMGLFISNSFIFNIIEVKCLPLNSLMTPEIIAQTLLPLLLGGIFTGVLTIERKKCLIAEARLKQESQARKEKVVILKISDILSKDSRVSQKRLLEECRKSDVIMNDFKEYMKILGMIDEYAKIISDTFINVENSLNAAFSSFSTPKEKIKVNINNIEAEFLQKNGAHYFEKYLNELIIHVMVDYVRHHQANSKSGNMYRLITNQPDRWTIQRMTNP